MPRINTAIAMTFDIIGKVSLKKACIGVAPSIAAASNGSFGSERKPANMINTIRETVTRTLLLLAQQGIIQKGAHRLIIVDPEALKKVAHG